MPSALGSAGRFFGYKDDTLIVRGPNNGIISFNDFQKGNLVEYGGDSGNKAPRGMEPLTFSLNQSYNDSQNMLNKLKQLTNLAGIEELTTMPMTPVTEESAGAADNL